MPFVEEICKQYGVDVRPIRSSCQVSRFDPWKDPVGVIEAFRIVRERGSRRAARARGLDGHRRPRGLPLLGADERSARAGDRDIHLLSNIQQVGNGADQRVPARRPTS